MLVMLDLDNTICDRDKTVDTWVKEFCQDRGLSPNAAAWIKKEDNDGYRNRRSVFESIRQHFNLGDPVNSLLSDYQRRIVELSTLSAGALSCLKSLREAGHVLAIVSNGSSQQQHGKVDALHLRERVDAVVVSGDLMIKKPDARIFQAAADQCNTSLVGSWMVGDSPLHDIIGGARCGAQTIWLDRGRQWIHDEIEPTITVSSLDGLTPRMLQSTPG